MGFKISSLWKAPEVNPVNNKARSIPIFNPFNVYGRVFLLSWWGFLMAFWSWYAFPPLMTVTIREDLGLSSVDVANSNILSLTATLIVRLTAGTACDRFGPRWTFAVLLLAGAIPTALAGTATNAGGIIALRCFIGILGGTFVPCQAWQIGFFDKNIVGTATSIAAGLGNAGGGITYFLMPAIFDSLVDKRGLTPRVAWRVTFIVPFILITATGLLMIFTCPDTPTGKWSARRRVLEQQLATRDMFLPSVKNRKDDGSVSNPRMVSDDTMEYSSSRNLNQAQDAPNHEHDLLEAASWELVEKPTIKTSTNALMSLATLTLIATYFASFGAELAINSFLGSYYVLKFPSLGQTGSGNWASMFGLLNIVIRPIGGISSDLIYRFTGSLWGKKMLLHFYVMGMGALLIVIGLVDPSTKAAMFGLIAGMAFFLEAANGACFALVPHVHPTSSGLITGVTGASGNLGGILFLLIARYDHTAYARTIWIIGVICIALNVSTSWIHPIPKGQLGGR